jgi:HEAT repeat protein
MTLGLSGFMTWCLPVAIQQAKANLAARRAEQEAGERRAAREAAEKAAREEAERQAAKQEAERIATNQTVLPRQNLRKKQQANVAGEWRDASLNMFQQGDIRVTLLELRVLRNHWVIRLQIENTGAGPKNFRPWSAANGNEIPRLADVRGKRFPVAELGQPGAPMAIQPGRSAEDVLAFEGAGEPTTDLRLELPASCFEGTGQLRMGLPENMAFFALAPTMGQKAVPRLVQALESDDPTTRQSAAGALARMGPNAATARVALSHALKDEEHDVRRLAANTLGNCGPEGRNALAGLLHALGDGDERVRQAASEALEKTGPPTAADVPALCAATRDQSFQARLYAVRAIEQVGAKAKGAAIDLIKSLKDSDGDVRAAAVSALVAIRPEPLSLPALVEVLRDDAKDQSAAAAEVFSRIGPLGAAALLELRSALKSPTTHVRAHAARSLGAIGAGASPAIPDLKVVLQDQAFDVREQAALALDRIGAGAGARAAPALVAALLDPDTNVSRRAREALERVGALTSEEVPGLIQALQKGNAENRAFAASALGGIGPAAKDAVTALAKAVTVDQELAVRQRAAVALGKIGPRAWESASALGKALQESDEQLRRNAAAALGAIGPDASKGVPGLILALKDKSFQEEATQALVRIGRGAILDLLEAAENPKDYDSRLKALAVLGKMGPEAKGAVDRLSILAKMDKAGSIRQAAKQALTRIEGKPK